MAPISILQIYSRVIGPMAHYFNAAAMTDDPVLRMKLVMTGSIAFMYHCHTWGKPLNPILGETYQGSLPDGSQVFAE